MPGTVQVSILELTGLSSSNSPSRMTIKVSLGKHTCEADGVNGEFLLPLATLRDNLVVKVHDTEGNEIARTDVKSRLIAEKGSWNDLFPLEGGGHVHMKLKFSLSEEERNKIRDMRESALKKKQEELLNKNSKDLQKAAAIASSGGRNEMFSTVAISDEGRSFDIPQEALSEAVTSNSSSNPSRSSSSAKVNDDDQRNNLKEQCTLEKIPSTVEEDDHNLTKQSSLDKTLNNIKEDDPQYNLKEQSPLEKTPRIVKEDDPRYILKKQSPLELTPLRVKEDNPCYTLKEKRSWVKKSSTLKNDESSHNLKENSQLKKTPSQVRKTVAAFESSLLSQGRMITVKAQPGGEITDAHSHEQTSESVSAQDAQPLDCQTEKVLESLSKRYQEHPTSIQPIENRSTSSVPKDDDDDKMVDKEIIGLVSDETQPSNSVTEQESASTIPSSPETERDSLPIYHPEGMGDGAPGRRRQCTCHEFRGWIFLEEDICSCIARSNRMSIDLHGDYSVIPSTYPRKLIEEVTSSREHKPKKPESSHSAGEGAPRGSNGQVMKVVIMVGFGLLVLFTRKSKS